MMCWEHLSSFNYWLFFSTLFLELCGEQAFFFITFVEVEMIYNVNFCCTAKWLSYTYIYISIMVYYRILSIVAYALQKDIVIYPFYI